MQKLQKINNTTFVAKNLGDVKPLCTIGGRDKSKFIPNLNVSFFDDEFFLNLNRRVKPALKAKINKAEISGNDKDIFHIDEEGRLKWDIEFNSCPDSMFIDWELKHTTGLDFFYQGELTKEEIAEGCFRPDEIIGSYAVYCNKSNNKYKTGKLCHITRPFVIDADEKREWCVLNISDNNLTIALPEKFMESARYPVTLDPTFGYNAIGDSDQLLNNTFAPTGMLYNSYIANANEEITQFSFYGGVYSDPAIIEMAAYTIETDDFVTKLENTTTLNISETSYKWHHSYLVNQKMVEEIKYGIALYCNTSKYINTRFDSERVNPSLRHNSAESLPPIWATGSTRDRIYSIYATYSKKESLGGIIRTDEYISQSTRKPVTPNGLHVLFRDPLSRRLYQAESGTIYITGDHSPDYDHNGIIEQKIELSSDHSPDYDHDGEIIIIESIKLSGSHSPNYSHNGAIEQQIKLIGNHSPTYSHSGNLKVQINIIGNNLPDYNHLGELEQQINILGLHSPDYSHLGKFKITELLTGVNSPNYNHSGLINIIEQISGNHNLLYGHSGKIDVLLKLTGSQIPIYEHTGEIYFELDVYKITGNHSPAYMHSGNLQIPLDITGVHEPNYIHTGKLKQQNKLVGINIPYYDHLGIIGQQMNIKGFNTPSYIHSGNLNIVEFLKGRHVPVYIHLGSLKTAEDKIYKIVLEVDCNYNDNHIYKICTNNDNRISKICTNNDNRINITANTGLKEI